MIQCIRRLTRGVSGVPPKPPVFNLNFRQTITPKLVFKRQVYTFDLPRCSQAMIDYY